MNHFYEPQFWKVHTHHLVSLLFALIIGASVSSVALAQRNGGATGNDRVSFLIHLGRFQEALPLAERTVATNEKKFGPRHVEVANALDNLGRLYGKLGGYAQAENAFRRALEILSAANDVEMEFARTLRNFAMLYQEQKRYDDAEPLFKQSFSIYEEELGDVVGLVPSLDDLSQFYVLQGRYAEAEALYKRAISILEPSFGPSAPALVKEFDNLAALYKRQKRFDESEALYRRTLSISEAAGPPGEAVEIPLQNLARFLMDRKRYSEAEPLFKRVLTIQEKTRGRNSPDVVATLQNLADLYLEQGRYPEVEGLFKRILEINSKASGASIPTLLEALSKFGQLYRLQGRYADAETFLKKALLIAEKSYGPDRVQTAMAANELGMLYDIQGRFPEAEALLKRAFAIEKSQFGIDSPITSRGAGDLAMLYRQTGRYAEAEVLFKQVVSVQEKALAAALAKSNEPLESALNRALAISNDNLGTLYLLQGRYAESEDRYKRALAIEKEKLSPDDMAISSTSNNLAAVYSFQGRVAGQEQLLQQSLAILEKTVGADHAEVGKVLGNLGALYWSQKRSSEAEELYNRALAIEKRVRGPNHPDVAEMLGHLAVIYLASGRLNEAQTFYRRELAIDEQVFGANHPKVASDLNALAECETQRGNDAEAEVLLRRALAIQEKAFGGDHPDIADTLRQLAMLLTRSRRYDDAQPLAMRAVTMSEAMLGPTHPTVAIMQNSLALIESRRDRSADAVSLVRATIINGFADIDIALPTLHRAQELHLVGEADAFDLALNVIHQNTSGAAAGALDKLAVRLAAGSDRLAELVRRDQDVAGETTALDTALAKAVAKQPSKRDLPAERRMKERLGAIAAERRDIESILTREYPDYAALSHPVALSAKDIQGLLSGDEAFVAFSVGAKETHVLALTRDNVAWSVVPLGAAALSGQVAAFRRGLDVDRFSTSVLAGKPELFDLAFAHELFSTLLGPVDGVIKDKKSVVFVPSGALTALPFHLLVTEPPAVRPAPADGKLSAQDIAPYRQAAWLLQRQAVSVLPSISSLKTLRVWAVKGQASKPLIGFGDPVFNPDVPSPPRPSRATRSFGPNAAYTEFWHGAGIDRQKLAERLPRLDSTADELEAVAKNLGAPVSDVHLREDASETTVKRAPLQDYRTVYFATHGLVAGDVKGLAEPSLALSLPRQPTDFDDGLLTASDVAQLKLNADWVVLSACNTIAGDKPGAEALSGLAKAFFYAGAKSMLVTHWSAASDAATRLTTATFDVLKSDPKASKPEALRRAMIAFLHDGSDPLNAYPAMWGPFAMIGVELK